MLNTKQVALEVEEAPMRFDPLGPDVYGRTQPQSLLTCIEEEAEPLLDLVDQHVVSIQSFRPQTLLQLFRLAAKYESNPERYITHNMPLQGKILINAFYEPSTRTRLSFDSAWHRLGGSSINITDRSTTGIAKGESLEDVAHMFNNYGDCVCCGTAIPARFMPCRKPCAFRSLMPGMAWMSTPRRQWRIYSRFSSGVRAWPSSSLLRTRGSGSA